MLRGWVAEFREPALAIDCDPEDSRPGDRFAVHIHGFDLDGHFEALYVAPLKPGICAFRLNSLIRLLPPVESARYRASWPVRLSRIGAPDLDGNLLDVSAEGCAAKMPEPVEVGTTLRAHIACPVGTVSVPVRVVNHRDAMSLDRYRIGFRIDPSDRVASGRWRELWHLTLQSAAVEFAPHLLETLGRRTS